MFSGTKRWFIAMLILIPAAVAVGQQVLRVNVNLVNVFVTVQDDHGDFVTNLTREDFAVYDDDQPQNISVFEKEGAVQSTVGLLMDTSGSMVDILPYMNRGVRDFAG